MSKNNSKNSNKQNNIYTYTNKSGYEDFVINEKEKFMSKCNHRKADNSADTLTENEDGSYTCGICGTTFNPLSTNYSKEDVKKDISKVIDIIETMKMIDSVNKDDSEKDNDIKQQYYDLILYLKKLPDLYEKMVNRYKDYERSTFYMFKQDPSMKDFFKNLMEPDKEVEKIVKES